MKRGDSISVLICMMFVFMTVPMDS